jgi:hypothetical protein
MCCALNLLHYAILCILTLTFHLHSCQSYIFKAQNKWRDAKAAYLKALEIDSGNAEYQAQLQEIEAKIQEDSRSSSTEGFPGGLNFEQFLQNPQFMHAASQMMSTPMFRSM